MGYDQHLAERVRVILADREGFSIKEMFGGVGFMLQGNMSCGVTEANLIVRVGPDAFEAALSESGVQEFDMTGRPMRGWVVVARASDLSDEALSAWVQRGVNFSLSLPPK
jgi:TfoX/Sxy family transcriptional regulator of competence genes